MRRIGVHDALVSGSGGEEPGPFGDTFEGELGLGQPQRSSIQVLHRGALHAASEVQEEFGDPFAFISAGDWYGSDGWDVIIITQWSKPPLGAGGGPKILGEDRVARLLDYHFHGLPEGVNCLREGCPRR